MAQRFLLSWPTSSCAMPIGVRVDGRLCMIGGTRPSCRWMCGVHGLTSLLCFTGISGVRNGDMAHGVALDLSLANAFASATGAIRHPLLAYRTSEPFEGPRRPLYPSPDNARRWSPIRACPVRRSRFIAKYVTETHTGNLFRWDRQVTPSGNFRVQGSAISLGFLVIGYRSSISLGPRERPTQIIIVSPSSFSSSVSTVSRWSGRPARTATSQLPQ